MASEKDNSVAAATEAGESAEPLQARLREIWPAAPAAPAALRAKLLAQAQTDVKAGAPPGQLLAEVIPLLPRAARSASPQSAPARLSRGARLSLWLGAAAALLLIGVRAAAPGVHARADAQLTAADERFAFPAADDEDDDSPTLLDAASDE